MVNKEKIIELVLKYHTNSNNGLVSKIQQENKGMNFKEATKILKEYYLENRTARMSTIWQIEEIIEEIVLNNIHKSDEIFIIEKSYSIAKSRYFKLIKSDDIFKTIMKQRGYKNINDMRAFAAICEGDISTYRIYSGNSDEALSYALLRTLAIATEYKDSDNQSEKSNEILKVAEDVLKYVYNIDDVEGLHIRKVMINNFKEKDFLLKAYKEEAIKGEVLFAPGIFAILKKYFEQTGDIEKYDNLKNIFENAFIKQEKVDEEKDNNCTEESNLLVDKNIENETHEEPTSLDEIPSEIEINIDEIGIETKVVEEEDNKENNIEVQNTEEKTLSKSEIAQEIKLRLEEIKSFVEKIESNDDAEDKQEYLDDIEELKKENIRLKNEVEILRKRVSEVSLKDFIQRVGGRECGYQLSELYMLSEGIMEDDGNTPGRLINLFGILQGYFLEAYIENYNINDEFEIDRKTLSQKYILEMPLRGDGEVVKVKLIRNGWKYNSEVIVPPLVRQLF